LVVDDDQHLQDIYRSALERVGCRVDMALNGEAALAKYQEAHADGDPFHVVLLDLNLPGMHGKECLDLIRQVDNNAKVIITSGDRNWSREMDLGPLAGILHKPFRLRTLVHSVASALQDNGIPDRKLAASE
jgi:DNA-binding response OmpR family regulator